MRLAVISDTHIPSRATEIPGWVVEAVEGADHTIHAGDFDSAAAYERVHEIADDPTVVRGNMDPALDLPDVATVEAGDVTFVVTHGTGAIETYRERVADIVSRHDDGDGVTVGISGHTHGVMDVEYDGYRLLNPGTATGADPATRTTMMLLEVDGSTVDVDVLEE